jgi:hypothetical protein
MKIIEKNINVIFSKICQEITSVYMKVVVLFEIYLGGI